jgi:hypothetical protein
LDYICNKCGEYLVDDFCIKCDNIVDLHNCKRCGKFILPARELCYDCELAVFKENDC